MKIRTDLTAFSLTGLCVVAMVAVVLAGREVPELLTTITLVSLGVSGGAAVPTVLGGRTSAPAPAAEPVAQVADVVPAPAPAPAIEQLPAPAAAAPVPAPTLGRDWTETMPAITPEMIAADKAGQ